MLTLIRNLRCNSNNLADSPSEIRSHALCKRLCLPRVFALVCLYSACAVAGMLVTETANAQVETTATTVKSADGEMERAKARFRQGAFAQAGVHWMEAARLYETEGKVNEQCQALINLAHAFEQEGHIKRAVATLQTALQLSEQTGNRVLTATIFGRLGNAFYAIGKGDQAIDHLTKGLNIAREEKKTSLEAVLLNDLGNVFSSRKKFGEAISDYSESKRLAMQAGQRALAATAQTNMALAHMDNKQFPESEKQLDMAYIEVRKLDNSYAKAYGLLNIGLGYDDLRSPSTPRMMAEAERQFACKTRARGICIELGNPLLLTKKRESPLYSPSDKRLARQASDSFEAAALVATSLGDPRVQSYAWGYLGTLLEKERRYEAALDFTRRAAFAAQKGNVPESSYRWQWQTARLLKASGKEDEALAAYNRAVAILTPIRYEYSVGYQGRHHSFRDSVAPLFAELEDTLLRRAALAQTPDQTQQLLVQVRDTVEASRIAELQDYFRDDCVAEARARRGASDPLPRNTAVLYPIMLADRLELLVNMAGSLKRYSVPVPAKELTQEVDLFRDAIQARGSKDYLRPAKNLYEWLMAPLQQDFRAIGVTTVVVVPDGPLRTIPMAALHDGREFLVNQYAVAVTPSMNLTDTRALDRGTINLLVMGLTESVLKFPALPNVASEVQAIRTLYGGHLLMDNQFIAPSVEREMKETGVEIVHIASHGAVDEDVNDSFVLAYDQKITMDRLSQLVGLRQYRENPLELLTLSACQTGVGDDRAALGLAGVAIKAGARSALASLWFIDDQATSSLIAEFYRQLKNANVTKAVSLQRAQLKSMSEPGHEHPSFWAPFLLISNWM